MNSHTNNEYNIKVISKEDTILHSLYEFYKEPKYIKQMLPIVTGVSKLSLRTLDWFVTNYAKNYEISYEIIKNNKKIQFVVHSDYKSQLKAYNKRFFDPFCRENKNNKKNRIPFKYNDDKYILTTIGQLNFFRWAIRNKVINYINDDNNFLKILADMNKINKKKRRYKIDNNSPNDKKSTKYKYKKIINFNNTSLNKPNKSIEDISNILEKITLNATSRVSRHYRITRLDF